MSYHKETISKENHETLKRISLAENLLQMKEENEKHRR
jgi:hypothetical protein